MTKNEKYNHALDIFIEIFPAMIKETKTQQAEIDELNKSVAEYDEVIDEQEAEIDELAKGLRFMMYKREVDYMEWYELEELIAKHRRFILKESDE